MPRRNYGRAADGLRRSARKAFAPAQTRLAMLYLAGGRGQDRVDAGAWLLLVLAKPGLVPSGEAGLNLAAGGAASCWISA